MIGQRRFQFLAFCCCLAVAPVAGQDDAIPSAKQVIAAYIDALGGEEKLQAIKTVTLATSSESLFGPPRSVTILWCNGRYLVKETVLLSKEKIKHVRQFGFDGEFEWQKLPSRRTGHKYHKTPRSLLLLEEYGVTPYALQLGSFEGKVTQNGKKEVSGRSTWHLSFEWPNGQKDDRFFDIKSRLLTRVEITLPQSSSGGLGGGGVRPRVFEWRDQPMAGLVTLKESIRTGADSEGLRTQIDSTIFDAEIDEAVFEIPENAREMKDGK